MRYFLWGAPCSGKTTLAKWVRAVCEVPLILEYATEWLVQNGTDAWVSAGPRIQEKFGRIQLSREQVAGKTFVTDSPAGLSYFYALQHPGKDTHRDDWEKTVEGTREVFRLSMQSGLPSRHIFLPVILPFDKQAYRRWTKESELLDLQSQLFGIVRDELSRAPKDVTFTHDVTSYSFIERSAFIQDLIVADDVQTVFGG
jgi:hypothetical protein